MRKFFERLDELAGIANGGAAAWLERSAFVFLVLMFAAAPHSIAATQTAWIIGMLAWIVRLFLGPREKFRFGWLDAGLWGLFLWSVVSSLVSYEPLISIDKLRTAAVFLIFYFVLYNVRNRRAAFFLSAVMIASCLVSAVWMPIERILGRGVEIGGVTENSPLAKAGLGNGDTILRVNGTKISSPDEAAAAIEQAGISKVRFHRPDRDLTAEVDRSDMLPGQSAVERLGIGSWKKSHYWRSKGFYGHYTTYAEVLQLIGSLALGLLAAALGAVLGRRSSKDARLTEPTGSPARRAMIVYAVAFAAIAIAMLLSVTRGPQLALGISGLLIVLAGLGRKWFLGVMLVMLPVAVGGVFVLRESRKLDFFDRRDESTLYRQMMMRDGLRLWTESPRHFVFGVGMDSLKEHWEEWRLFDRGWQPMGHFHSTPVQLLAERGLPALLLWIGVVGVYAVTILKGLKRAAGDRRSRGILLGCLGGLAGFVTSSIAHYNLGDQEVAMVFFILMGIAVRLARELGADPGNAAADAA